MLLIYEKNVAHATRMICDIRKNSNAICRMGRIEKNEAREKAVRPVAPYLIQLCEKSNIAGKLDRD